MIQETHLVISILWDDEKDERPSEFLARLLSGGLSLGDEAVKCRVLHVNPSRRLKDLAAFYGEEARLFAWSGMAAEAEEQARLAAHYALESTR